MASLPFYDSDNSSRLSSPLSRSPTPPSEYAHMGYKFDYPSPSSDLTSLGSTPTPDGMQTPRSSQSEQEGSPHPAKRRKLSLPKERTTEQLDITNGDVDESEKAQLDKLLKVLYKKRKIVVVCGAGVSVSAGIPDFRSSTGLFKTLKREHNLKSSGKDLFDASVYKDGDSTTSFHAMVRNLSTATKTAKATPFHHLLATLADENRLLRLYSQNVDGIDTSLKPLATKTPLPLKGPWPKTIQLHGSLEHMTCTKCSKISTLDPDMFDGPSPPPCQHCEEADGVRTQHAGKRSHGVGVMRPRMVLYNEHNPDDEAIGAVVKADLRTRPDALIVVGTTLKVPGVKRIVKEMSALLRDRRDGVTIWINNDPPPALKDYEWDLVVQGPCDHVASLAKLRKWDQPESPTLYSDEHIAKIKREQGIPQVIIMSPSKKGKTFDRVQGVPTPAASPKLKPQQGIIAMKPAKAAAPSKKQMQLAGTKRKAETGKPATTASKKAAAKTTGAKPKKSGAAAKSQPKAQSSGIKLNFRPGKNLQPMKLQAKTSKPEKAPSEAVVEVLLPLSPGQARNNSNPPHLPSGKPYFDGRGKSLSIDTSTPIKESAEERKRIITPPGVPKNMAILFS